MSFLFIAPAVLLFVIFVLGPLVASFYWSFTKYDAIHARNGWDSKIIEIYFFMTRDSGNPSATPSFIRRRHTARRRAIFTFGDGRRPEDKGQEFFQGHIFYTVRNIRYRLVGNMEMAIRGREIRSYKPFSHTHRSKAGRLADEPCLDASRDNDNVDLGGLGYNMILFLAGSRPFQLPFTKRPI